MMTSFISRIDGEIDMETLLRIQKEFKNHTSGGANEIRLYINSPGGSVQAGLMLHELISNSDVSVLGIAQGECGSIALTVLQACDSRCAEEDVRFLAHGLSFVANTMMYYDMQLGLKVRDAHMSLQEDIIRLHVVRSGMSRENFIALLIEGRELSARTAQKLGMIDGIIMGGH